MPTVVVNREHLFEAIGKKFTDDEFDQLCFEFGIELDEITSEKQMLEKEHAKKIDNLSDEVLYRIEVPANRYDLLCLEGLSLSLRVFLGLTGIQNYKIKNFSDEINKFYVESSVANIRPYVCSAILRNIKFTNDTLISFMELQDKLHHNVCRGRTLVSMGTHDLDTVKGPFYFRALPPEQIKFRPLNRQEELDGVQLINTLNNDPKLKHYTHLLKDEPLFPVLCDSNNVVMALPPLINSEHSKLTINTRNVFIDITAKDLTKAKIVLNTLVSMFSLYCDEPFTIEEVQVVTSSGKVITYPDISTKSFQTDKTYINNITGCELSNEEIIKSLLKMGLKATLQDEKLNVEVPITRTDILHACDIAEDVAIAYGYNNITKKAATTICNGYQQPINKLTDLIRFELAAAGYIECLTMALISKKDMFTNMLEEINEKILSETVQIYKSKTSEFEVFRTSLIPGILKTIEANKANQLPLKVFEISDVCYIDDKDETGAINRRKLCFAYTNLSSGIEVIHGLVDHLLSKMGLEYNNKTQGYYIEPSNEKGFFPDRQAHLYVLGKKCGIFGIVHPKILKNFSIKTPISLCEIDIEYIFDLVINKQILKGV